DRAGIDAEGFGGFLAGDDEATPLAEVVHVEGALPHVAPSVRVSAEKCGSSHRRESHLRCQALRCTFLLWKTRGCGATPQASRTRTSHRTSVRPGKRSGWTCAPCPTG